MPRAIPIYGILSVQIADSLRALREKYGEFGSMNQVILLWGYASEEDRRERRAKLPDTPGWIDFLREAAPMIQSEESRLLKPA